MNTMENSQRKIFRKLTASYCREIQDASDLTVALAKYRDCQLIFNFVAALWPSEPLELQRGNVRVSLEMAMDNILKKIDDEGVNYSAQL